MRFNDVIYEYCVDSDFAATALEGEPEHGEHNGISNESVGRSVGRCDKHSNKHLKQLSHHSVDTLNIFAHIPMRFYSKVDAAVATRCMVWDGKHETN